MALTIDTARAQLAAVGQEHLLQFADSLDEASLAALLSQIGTIDFSLLAALQRGEGLVADVSPDAAITPTPVVRRSDNEQEWLAAEAAGEAALRDGRLAAFVVAGGQGTRLGFDGPKGTYPVLPETKGTLFQIFAEKLLFAARKYGKTVPLYVMTSAMNHAATEAFWKEHGYFGLDAADVSFFSQAFMPAVDPNGKVMLADKGSIAMSPNGHGGSLAALVDSGAVADMRKRGIEYISYFQVDNPLVQIVDPAFLGFHIRAGSEMSSKVLPKAAPLEKVGNFCRVDDKLAVVEYSDMPEALARQSVEQDATGAFKSIGDDASPAEVAKLRFNAGNIAIHAINVDFVNRMGGGEGRAVSLPFHKANKKIPTVDASGAAVTPDAPNGVKYEMFVFDAVTFAKNSICVETVRCDDFGPVKNADGVDSPASSRALLDDQARRWLRAAGVADADLPAVIEISPTCGTTEADFVAFFTAAKPAVSKDAPLVLRNDKK